MVKLNTTLFFQIFNLSHKSSILDFLMIFGAKYMIFLTFFLVAILALLGKGKKREGLLLIIIGTVIALMVEKAIHIFFFVPRPFITYQITPLISHLPDASFPSEHISVMATIAFSYYFCKSKFAPVFLFLMLWVGFARIFVGVHYPLDILGGITTGFISAFFARQLLKWAKNRLTSTPPEST